MTLASLFRPAGAPDVLPGRHAAPETGDEERSVAAGEARPGRHAAEEENDYDEDGDLLDSLGFGYEDDDEGDDEGDAADA